MKSSATRLKEIIDVFKKYQLPKEINPVNVRKALEDLGPTFIKMGQIMSSREDLIPKAYANELVNLRSSVTPMPFEQVKSILEREYGKPLKEYFLAIEEEPIGSASIAQVHRAKLLNGETVAIKVERENISELMKMDTYLLKKAISLLHINKLTGDIIDFNDVVDEMYERAKEEMDFLVESKHIKEFTKNNEDLVYIKPLKVYYGLSYSNILVMEYIDAPNINDKATLRSQGYIMEEIGEKLAHNYIKQAIDDGLYHADPHPDNIKIIDGKIAYLDFGMMGRLSPYNRDLLQQCIKAIVMDDISTVARILVMMDTKKSAVDYMQLKNDIRRVLDKTKNTGVSNIDMRAFISDMLSLLQSNAITLPKEITMLTRGIVVIEGTLKDISPNISLIQVFKNRIDYKDLIGTKPIKETIINGAKSAADLVYIPNELLTTLKGINSGELKFNIELNDSKNQLDKVERIVHLLIITILDVALIIGTSQIYTKTGDLPLMFYIYFISSIICTVWLLYKMIIIKFNRY